MVIKNKNKRKAKTKTSNYREQKMSSNGADMVRVRHVDNDWKTMMEKLRAAHGKKDENGMLDALKEYEEATKGGIRVYVDWEKDW